MSESKAPAKKEVKPKAISQAEWAHKKNINNILTKLNEGKSISAAESKLIQDESDKASGKTWVYKKIDLCNMLNISRPTLDAKERIPGFPMKDARRGWCFEEVKKFCDDLKGGGASGVLLKQADATNVERGASFTLTRLEEQEAQLYANYTKAMESGLPEQVKICQDLWLSISKRLKEYEIIIDKDKRDAGETIQRTEAERLFALFGQAINNAEEQALDLIAIGIASLENPKDPRSVRQASKGLLYAKVEQSLGQLIQDDKTPSWVREAFIKGVRP